MKAKFSSMKIEINEQQPLDEVVRELGSKGYKQVGFNVVFSSAKTYICTSEKGCYVTLMNPPTYCTLTTLDELRGM